MVFRRKFYGQNKKETCAFCDKDAYNENSQGLPTCSDHKKRVMEEKKCVCGGNLEIKKSKWGVFYLCINCGPISKTKASDTATEGYNINKKYRKEPKEIKYEDRIYTIEELEKIWSQ